MRKTRRRLSRINVRTKDGKFLTQTEKKKIMAIMDRASKKRKLSERESEKQASGN